MMVPRSFFTNALVAKSPYRVTPSGCIGASDLAIQTLKDTYSFDFLTMREDYDEKELEDALVNQITQFLLKLGTGFSYVRR